MGVVADLIRDMELWKPQREGLEALDRIITASPIGRGITKKQTLGAMMVCEPPISYAVQQPDLFNFQDEINPNIGTEFPSFCFAIATGGGKTRLMGACIAYLYYTKGFKNFFVLSKGETIYNKHRFEDFAPASPKYVFKGLAGFPVPRLIDGDNYHRCAYPELFSNELTLYLFNIEKIFNERTDVEFRFHRFHENIGSSFADVLRSKPDLVLLMDESHNIRAEKSLRAVNALKPILGLEFTATPKARNVIYTYPLVQAINDGLVKRPVVLTRPDEDSFSEEKEDIKLSDGILRHERKKAKLETYCRNSGLPVVPPRVLISTQSIAHSEAVKEKLEADDFWEGRYKGKVLLVHSGSAEEQIQHLLNLEKIENRIEIVVHVNKLKEGWDVKTIYTIIPLRASVSDILTEQTIGRGLRLPFGKALSRDASLSKEEREQLLDIDTLEIMSHDNYLKVLDARKRAGPEWSAIQVETLKPEGAVEPLEITPDGDKQYLLNIPEIRAAPRSQAEIDLTGIAPSFEQLHDVDLKLIGTDLATLEQRDYDSILEECHGSLVNLFVRILIETGEFDIRDKAMLQRLAQGYLDKVQVVAGERKEVLFKHRGKIAQDMLEQIKGKVAEKTTIDYTPTGRMVEFRSYWRSLPRGYSEKHKDAVVEEELTHHVIVGYAKTIFPKNVFDSKQEKWLADILDRDNEVVRWVRPASGQMPIRYKGGNYNPDFVAEADGDKFCLLEVKARHEIDHDDDVKAKAHAGNAWCGEMTRATQKRWEYKLIPHDAIQPTLSFRAVLSAAVSLGVDQPAR